MATITKVGTYTGDGAIQIIPVGFLPDYVKIVNFTAPAVDEWFYGLASGTSITTTGTAAVRASPGGVTRYNGPLGQGFSVGIALSTAASVYYYEAVSSGPGAG